MKLDVTKIEGYAEMTAEEKVAALEQYEIEDNSKNLKELLSKKNSENAELNKQLRAKMSAEEKAEADRAEREAQAKAEKDELLARLNQLETDKKLADITASYISVGFDKETAKKNANALISGNYEEIFTSHKELNEAIKAKAIAESMDKDHLTPGQPPQNDTSKLREAMGLH